MSGAGESHDKFYQEFQIPVFVVTLVLTWFVITARLYAFRITFCGWKTWRGISTLLVLLTGLLCTSYLCLIITSFVLNKKIRSVLDREDSHVGEDGRRDPAYYTDEECAEVGEWATQLIDTLYTERYVLTSALWMTKFAFLSVFLETRQSLNTKWRVGLYFTAFAIVSTLILSMWAVSEDYIWVLTTEETQTTPENIRAGAYVYGAHFILLDNAYEYILISTNLITDLFLVLIAIKTVQGLNLPVRAVWIVFGMVVVTVLIAIGRFATTSLLLHISTFSNVSGVPFELLSEFETFMAAIVCCLPGLRVVLRRGSKSVRESGIENYVLSGAPASPDVTSCMSRNGERKGSTVSSSNGPVRISPLYTGGRYQNPFHM